MSKQSTNNPVYVLLQQPWDFDQSFCIEDQLCGTFTTSEAAIKEGLRRMSCERAEENVSLKAKIVHEEENKKWRIEMADEPCYIVVKSTPE